MNETEVGVIHDLAGELEDTILTHAPDFLNRLTTEVTKAGLPNELLPYVTFLIMDQHHNWPAMNPRWFKALDSGKWIMEEGGLTPNYKGKTLVVPRPELEGAVNQAILAIARWAASVLTEHIRQQYRALLQKYAKDEEAALPNIPANTGRIYLKADFEYLLSADVSRFANGFLLEQVVARLLK